MCLWTVSVLVYCGMEIQQGGSTRMWISINSTKCGIINMPIYINIHVYIECTVIYSNIHVYIECTVIYSNIHVYI